MPVGKATNVPVVFPPLSMSVIKKRPVSPRQKMINLMYILLLAMLALNVSSDVLKGFQLVSDSLVRSVSDAEKENQTLYDNFAAQLKANPTKVGPWAEKAQQVKTQTTALYAMVDSLRWAIAREADGRDGTPDHLQNQEDLNAAEIVMLSPLQPRGKRLFEAITRYRNLLTSLAVDNRQRALIASYLNTDVPRREDTMGKNWQEYMFEQMPAVAAITLLTKLQNDIRSAEGEVLRTLAANIDLKDIRVNALNAYVVPEATTLFPGEEFRSTILMAAIDTTLRPTITVNGRTINGNGQYNFRVGAPGQYSFSGTIAMLNAAGETVRRNFTQKYTVIAPPSGATVAADLMNVLYAGFNNPVSVSASGINADKVSLTMSGGSLTPQGNGRYIARPATVGKDVTFTVTGQVGGKTQTMGTFTFKVRKLPDPTAYIAIGGDAFKGGHLSKAAAVNATTIGAAIDDGLLNIPFRVLSFETVFFDRMGNARPERSAGPTMTNAQRELIRSLRQGQRFYISRVRAIGPDGIERNLPQAVEVIIQ